MKTIIDNIIANNTPDSVLTPKDFKPNVDVRWCSGCGAYSVLSPVQKIMPGLGIPKEKFAIISGIGCSGRFPYYMDAYGVHGIHGRPIAIASGLKIARPDLSVWVAAGDGDTMSIGGNHFIHGCRRNVDLNMMMFNNEVYSLTKGQFSPTSRRGQVTKTSPLGVLDDPFNPALLALGAGAGFVARGYDKDIKMTQHLLERAAKYKGFSFVELYANCVIFNDNAFDDFTKKGIRDENSVNLEHGKPLVFGIEKDKGIKLDGFKPIAVSLTDGSHSVDDLLVHDEQDSTLAVILANMTYNENLPHPVGVFQAIERPPYEERIDAQIAYEQEKAGGIDNIDFDALLKGDECWEVK